MTENDPSLMTDPRELVRSGYDEIADAYAAWAERSVSVERDRLTRFLLETLPPGSSVLDLGCGNGLPSTGRLAERFVVFGVDFSEAQIRSARRNVPGARFACADMTGLTFPDEAFDAVTAYFSIIHVPRDAQPDLFAAISHWLRPGGHFIFSTGATATEAGYEEDWLGAPMYWSHHDPKEVRKLLEQSRLNVVEEVRETVDEDGTPVPFVWFLCRKSVTG